MQRALRRPTALLAVGFIGILPGAELLQSCDSRPTDCRAYAGSTSAYSQCRQGAGWHQVTATCRPGGHGPLWDYDVRGPRVTVSETSRVYCYQGDFIVGQPGVLTGP